MFNRLFNCIPGAKDETIVARASDFALAPIALLVRTTHLPRYHPQAEQLSTDGCSFQSPLDRRDAHPAVYDGLSYDCS